MANPNFPKVVFIYYSGHGCMTGADSNIITGNGERVNIDKYIREISSNPNVVVIALIDACREDLAKNPNFDYEDDNIIPNYPKSGTG